MNSTLIQQGLQSMNTVSCLLYLSDYYGVTTHVYVESLKSLIITSDKVRKTFYIHFKDNKWFGVGIMYFADGSKYYGEHERGRTGQGILVGADGKVKVGIWNRNKYVNPLHC